MCIGTPLLLVQAAPILRRPLPRQLRVLPEESYPFLHFPLAVLHGCGPALHSSLPCLPSLAVKKRVSPTAVRFWGSLLALPRRMFLTIVVPLRVPSLRQSSWPCLLSMPTK